MKTLIDVKAMMEADTFGPKVRFTVSSQDTFGSWHKWPNNERPQRFRDLDRAKYMRRAIVSGEDTIDSFICRETTVFFSDIQTRETFSLTEYVVIP